MLVAGLIACSPREVTAGQSLIPKPEQMTMTGGTFTVDSLALFGGQSSRNIKTVIDEAWSGNPEGYQLDVTPGGIDLRAGSPDGLFYGMQTLRQLYAGGEVPCVSIRDNPRFGYRGLHLDVSRHFFSKEEVMKLLDVMSYYKLNTLHMHLTDAGGWRIEIDKYPKLTSEWPSAPNLIGGSGGTAATVVSAGRDAGRLRRLLYEGGHPGDRETCGFQTYTNIIPEIEFPGHSEEVLMAYPELSCPGKPY
ncbi:MAG: family 20 glycosylhydrolase [Parabacteroides merdae]